jgi:hypothetical protein
MALGRDFISEGAIAHYSSLPKCHVVRNRPPHSLFAGYFDVVENEADPDSFLQMHGPYKNQGWNGVESRLRMATLTTQTLDCLGESQPVREKR